MTTATSFYNVKYIKLNIWIQYRSFTYTRRQHFINIIIKKLSTRIKSNGILYLCRYLGPRRQFFTQGVGRIVYIWLNIIILSHRGLFDLRKNQLHVFCITLRKKISKSHYLITYKKRRYNIHSNRIKIRYRFQSVHLAQKIHIIVFR